MSSIVNLHDGPRFETVSFPALRRLRITNELPTHDHVPHQVFPLDLLAKLECLDIDGDDATKVGFKGWFDLDDLPQELPVVWRLNGERAASEQEVLPSYLQRAAHLRLYQNKWCTPSYCTARDKLRGLLDTHRNLRLVIVSEPFLSAASSPPKDGDEPILAECERRGLEVRSYSSAPEDGELVAPEFVAFVREKAARARTATAAGQS